MLDRQTTVADLVLDQPACAALLQHHHIDFCCRGNLTLEAAATARGLDADALLREIARTVAGHADDREDDPRSLSTRRLVAHLVAEHHEHVRDTLPFVQELADNVAKAHGARAPKLRALASHVDALADALYPHLDLEEQCLFPALMARTADHATVEAELGTMLREHEALAGLLERIREDSDEFRPPRWAGNRHRTLFAALERLQGDVFAHIHLENHVLARRFLDGR